MKTVVTRTLHSCGCARTTSTEEPGEGVEFRRVTSTSRCGHCEPQFAKLRHLGGGRAPKYPQSGQAEPW